MKARNNRGKKNEKAIGNISPITKEQNYKILSQQEKNICKIYLNIHSYGTGFFCKIPYPNEFTLLPVLITNNHVLNAEDIRINKKIVLSINDNKTKKELLIDDSRKAFTDKDIDITFIEIRPNIDKIKYFLDVDENINYENIEEIYKTKQIYIIQYPKGLYSSFSTGIVKKINDSNILHTCSTDVGSSGSPILCLLNYKVIGIHKGKANINFNQGIFIKKAISTFNNYYQSNFLYEVNILNLKKMNVGNQLNKNALKPTKDVYFNLNVNREPIFDNKLIKTNKFTNNLIKILNEISKKNEITYRNKEFPKEEEWRKKPKTSKDKKKGKNDIFAGYNYKKEKEFSSIENFYDNINEMDDINDKGSEDFIINNINHHKNNSNGLFISTLDNISLLSSNKVTKNIINNWNIENSPNNKSSNNKNKYIDVYHRFNTSESNNKYSNSIKKKYHCTLNSSKKNLFTGKKNKKQCFVYIKKKPSFFNNEYNRNKNIHNKNFESTEKFNISFKDNNLLHHKEKIDYDNNNFYINYHKKEMFIKNNKLNKKPEKNRPRSNNVNNRNVNIHSKDKNLNIKANYKNNINTIGNNEMCFHKIIKNNSKCIENYHTKEKIYFKRHYFLKKYYNICLRIPVKKACYMTRLIRQKF